MSIFRKILADRPKKCEENGASRGHIQYFRRHAADAESKRYLVVAVLSEGTVTVFDFECYAHVTPTSSISVFFHLIDVISFV